MGKTWYSYPSLLRKASTAGLDCLDSFICAGMIAAMGEISYTPARNTTPASVYISFGFWYKLIPLAISDGVPIRGDNCNAQTGAFNDSRGFRYDTGCYWIGHITEESVPYEQQWEPTHYYYSSRRSCAYNPGYVTIPKNSGRLNFDFNTMTGSYDARIGADLWAAFIDSTVNNDNAPARCFAADYPNQSVNLSNLQSGANAGFVFNFAFTGDKTTPQYLRSYEAFNLYDETGAWRHWTDDPINNYFFKIPFNRS